MDDCIHLSVIVPVYNAEHYLQQCIESLTQSSRQDFEVILVDDGSRDSSSAICDEYAAKDARIMVIHQANKGVSVARNTGMKASKGVYISFVDSDDYVEPSYVDIIIEKCDKVDMLFFGVAFHTPEGRCDRLLPPPCIATGRQEIMEQMRRVMAKPNGTPFTWSKAFRRQLLVDSGLHFTEGLSLCEDTILTYDYLALARRIVWIDDLLYHYRTGLPTSIGHGQHTPQEMETIARETARLSHLFADGYGVSENLRNMAGAYILLQVMGHRGLCNILEAHRKARSFCRVEKLKMPYMSMVWPVVKKHMRRIFK